MNDTGAFSKDIEYLPSKEEMQLSVGHQSNSSSILPMLYNQFIGSPLLKLNIYLLPKKTVGGKLYSGHSDPTINPSPASAQRWMLEDICWRSSTLVLLRQKLWVMTII
jgi:hypothetical protein